MRTIKKSIAVLLALFLAFSVVFCVSCSTVSAAEVTSACFSPSGGAIWSTYISSEDKAQVTDCLKRLFERCNLNSDDYYIFIGETFTYNNQPYLSNLVIFPSLNCTEQYKAENGIYYNILVYEKAFRTSQTLSGIDNINSLSFTNNTTFYKEGIFFNSDKGYGFGQIRDYGNGSVQSSPSFHNTWVFIDTFNPPFIPEGYELVNLPFYSLDVDDFETWIINNNKIDDLPSYIGVNKLKSFLRFYKEFGSSNSNFTKKIVDWFSFMNIHNQTKDNIAVLKQSIDTLYQEYLQYISGTHAYWPGATKIQERQNIDTKTKDDNTVLITDDSNDTLDISILRDILRGVIAISNNLNEGFANILGSLSRLNFVVNVSNNGGANDGGGDNSLSIDYTDHGNFGIDEIHQYEPLPDAPDIDGDVDFLEYPAVLAQTSTHFFNLLPNDMSALMSAVLVLGVLINKLGR